VRQPLLLESGEFLEEGLNVENDARANQVGALRVDEARGQKMEADERCEVRIDSGVTGSR
jgi:hypothetical protein